MDLILARGREVFERGQAASVAQWLARFPETDRTREPSRGAVRNRARLSGQRR
jgi:hypothetical protein